jgi:hypothetical protein
MHRTTDVFIGFLYVAIRPDAIIKSWNFFRENWDEFFSRQGTKNVLLKLLDILTFLDLLFMV